LTQYDDEGNIVVAGTFQSQNGLLLRALLGQTFYDNSTGQVQPRFDTPEAQALLEEWKQFYNDVIANIQFERINFDDIPLMVEQTYRLRNTNEDANWQAALLPGGAAGLDVQAVAVSAGTPHPQLAYELAKFLTSDAEIVNYIYGDTPARRSLVGVEAENSMIRRPDVPEEAQMVIDQAVENGLAASDRLFEDYFSQAASISAIEGTDTQVALQEAEQQAQADLEEATTRGETAVVTVATPVPTPVLSQSEVALRFSINANISPLPNREQWEDLAQEFIAADPQVGHIELTSNLGSQNQEEPDCYYSGFNPLDSMNLAEPTLLSLDPLMNADPNFDRADFIPQVLDQLTREDQIWGLPMTIEPTVIWYNPESFAEANVPEPETGWTVSQFADALQMIYANNDDVAVFQPPFGTNTYLLMLMAAYGSVPYDHRTMPPTINFTSEADIATMQQVLDLAKEGYINYQELADMGGGGYTSGQTPLIGDTLSLQNWRLQFRAENEAAGVESQRLTTFPVGTQYTPLSYQIGAGYISVDTLHPEACYRWLSFVSQNPTLFTSMPARFSQLNHPDIVALGDDVVALYQSYADLFSGPDVIVFTPYGAINYFGASIEQIWMNRAFDNYILEDADLESELQLAESNIMTYRDCATGLPELNDPDIPQEEAIALVRQYADCAIGVDPTMEERYSYLDDIE
jgi:ABC-type glycerol-3-phosphate transport system substrate-binding protein